MSEQQTPHAIEDVLSSIRRLVTQGERPHTGPAPHGAAALDAGALVLTPSLRVVNAPEASEAEDPLLLLGEPEVAAPWPPEADLSEDRAEDAEALDGEDWTDGPEAEERWPSEEDVAALAALDGTDTAGGTDALAGSMDRTALEVTIAELEEAVTRQIDEWEPDGAEEDVDWSVAETGAAAFFSSRLGHRPNGAAPPLTLVNPEPRSAPVDRELLRELVAEVVREQLEGELGERITRNVRRLVRREVNQALAIRDLG